MRAWIAAIALLTAGTANAATFHIVYDAVPDQVIGTLVGSGTFSYDGPPAAGAFTLSSLTGLTFDATVSGQSFTTADLRTSLSLNGIFVYSTGGGEYGMVFTGLGVSNTGSLNLNNGAMSLSHEPTFSVGNRVGCCGGNGSVNLYKMFVTTLPAQPTGDYMAGTLLLVPEPSALALCTVGLIALIASRRLSIH